MPVQLLPASAAAFAPRASSVNVVLGNKIEPWLTQTLKRINRVKRPLNSVPQHQRCLTETLSSPNAIWTLTSIMLPKTPEADFKRDPHNPLVEAITNYQLVHVEAYIVHVDMVLRHEVAYKLTADTIEALIEYHKEVHCVDAKANTYDWSEKEQQCKKLHEDFVQAINKFVYRTHVTALEGLEEEGAGELLNGKSEEVKNNIAALMKQLLPPPPRIVDVVRQPPLLPSSPAHHMWSQPGIPSNIPAVDAWRILPSSPSVTSSTDSTSPIWAPMGMSDAQISPTPAYSQPYSTAGFFYSSPQATAPIPSLPLPSMLAPVQCGVSMAGMGQMGGMGSMGGMGGFGWDRYQEYATIM
ncbi:Fc.00g112670.m01.CDS01 [Cosmosporella sp. VM-42]